MIDVRSEPTLGRPPRGYVGAEVGLEDRGTVAVLLGPDGRDLFLADRTEFLDAVAEEFRVTVSPVAEQSRIAGQVRQFHAMIGQLGPGHPSLEQHTGRLAVRKRLLREEMNELIAALDNGDLVAILDGLADVVYAAYGTAETYGLPLDAALSEVHASNMTKEPGADGKAVKGAGYIPPDLVAVLGRTGHVREEVNS